MALISINPFTNQRIKEYQEHTSEEVAQKIEHAHQAWLDWRSSEHALRSKLLNNLAAVLRKRKDELAQLMADEMGKPVSQGIAEVEKCAVCCEYYAANGQKFLADKFIETEASRSYVSFQPLGVILAIMPWNFPFWQVFRFLAPALAAGNTAVLKHASNVPGCALVIADMVNEAGFPKNIFQTILIGSKGVEKMVENKYIAAVTLTGSTNAGIEVAKKAGSLLKKTVLELGGSDGYIVLADADLKIAVEACVEGRLVNSGQSCIAAKRFIVEEKILEKFTHLFVEKMKSKKMGDPKENTTDIGPQARADLRDELHEQVKKSMDKGAKCLLGGEIPQGENAFYPATVLINVKPGMPAYDEELFGPVASIISAKDEADAIRIANDTNFGLGSAIFTSDIEKGERMARNELQAGSAFVNARVQSDSRLPFGGIKQSGYGRELSEFGIHEFVNIKTVYVR